MERVHIHLDIPFNSTVQDKVAAALQQKIAAQPKVAGKEMTEKDKTPSDPQLDRPQKVDDDQKKMQDLQDRKTEDVKDVKPKAKRKPAKKQPKKASGDTGKEETKTESVRELPKEEPKKVEEKPKELGVKYDRANSAHKVEFARMLDVLVPNWRTTADFKKECKIASEQMEGEILYTKSGSIAKKFSDKLEELLK